MATLQKIRNHGVILLVIVGLAMLAFILGDFLNSGSSFFHRNREYVGEIEGQKIHYTDYEAAKDQLTEVYKIETGRTNLDEELNTQIRNQVWQAMLNEYTLQAQAKEIGMDVTSAELSELCIGQNPHQLIRQRRTFCDENGVFNREALIRFHSQVFGNNEAADAEQSASLQQAKTYWLYWEKAVRLSQLQDKYTGLLRGLLTANKIDAKYAFNGRQESVDATYAMQPYSTVSDSLVNVTKRDLKEIYNELKPLFKQTPNRSVEYVSFAIVPSAEDFQAAEQVMNDLKEEFATTDDIALVVNTNSDLMYDGRNYSIETVPAMYKDFAFGAGAHKNAVTEISFADDTYSMARLVDCGYSMPDSVKLRPVIEGQEEQEAMWYTEAMLTKDIADKVFAAKKGEKVTIAQGLGELTLEVADVAKATPKVKLAILERKVTPSSKTYSILYNEAKQFIVNNNTEELFRGAVAENNMTLYPAYNLDKNADKIGQLQQSRPIVRWAYEANEGDLSDVFECGDQFVIALLSNISEGEYRPMKEVEGELQVRALNRKKAQYIKKELAGVSTLDEAAQKMNTNVQTAQGVTLNAYTFGLAGVEPAAIGTALALNAGELSQPVEGNNGVFMIVAGEKSKAAAEFDEAAEIRQAASRYAYLPYQIINLMEEKSDIVDNRSNFQ